MYHSCNKLGVTVSQQVQIFVVAKVGKTCCVGSTSISDFARFYSTVIRNKCANSSNIISGIFVQVLGKMTAKYKQLDLTVILNNYLF